MRDVTARLKLAFLLKVFMKNWKILLPFFEVQNNFCFDILWSTMLLKILCSAFGLSAKLQTFKRRYSLLAACRLFSTGVVTSPTRMRVIPVSALSDNYMYIVIDEKTKACAVVDPVEPEKLLKRIHDDGSNLTTILTTHHHYDHAGMSFQSGHKY